MTPLPSVEEIIAAVAKHMGVFPLQEMKPRSAARAIAAYLMRYTRSMSYPEIAQALGFKSHTTVMDAVLAQSHKENIAATANEIVNAIEEARK